MARIRNIKPAFFQHEVLQDLETMHPGKHIMLVYAGLWSQCDNQGVFEWKPRTLKCHILPLLTYDIEQTLEVLLFADFILKFQADNGKQFGYVKNFNAHQALSHKEKMYGKIHPPLPETIRVNAGTVPAQSRNSPSTVPEHFGVISGTADIGHRTKDIGHRTRDISPAPENFKTENLPLEATKEEIAPQIQETAESSPETNFKTCKKKIIDWCKPDNFANLRNMQQEAKYQPETHGPVNNEVEKFILHYIDKEPHRILPDPSEFFRKKFPLWLRNAKQMNRPTPSAGKKDKKGFDFKNVRDTCFSVAGMIAEKFKDSDIAWFASSENEAELQERIITKAKYYREGPPQTRTGLTQAFA